MPYRRYLADRCVRTICHANGGAWPSTLMEWRRVCRRFNITLKLVRGCPGFTALLLDDLIIVRYSHDCGRVHPWIAHEVSEFLLRSDIAGPPCVVPFDADCHHIARLAENG